MNASTTVMISKENTGTTITTLVGTSTCGSDGHCKIDLSLNLRTQLTSAETGTKTWRTRCESIGKYCIRMSQDLQNVKDCHGDNTYTDNKDISWIISWFSFLLVFLLNESVELDQLQCCRCIEFMRSPFPTSSSSRKARDKTATITFVLVKTGSLNIIALSQSKTFSLSTVTSLLGSFSPTDNLLYKIIIQFIFRRTFLSSLGY